LSFFFSSRRRHTRFSRDWSSDVCSSDLGPMQETEPNVPPTGLPTSHPRTLSSKCGRLTIPCRISRQLSAIGMQQVQVLQSATSRSEERRVGKKCGAL